MSGPTAEQRAEHDLYSAATTYERARAAFAGAPGDVADAETADHTRAKLRAEARAYAREFDVARARERAGENWLGLGVGPPWRYKRACVEGAAIGLVIIGISIGALAVGTIIGVGVAAIIRAIWGGS